MDQWQTGPVSTFQLELEDNSWWCFGNGSTIPTAGIDAEAAGGANRAHTDPGVFSNPTLGNDYQSCATPFPLRALSRGFNPAPTVPDQIFTIDPRIDPTNGAGLLATDPGRCPRPQPVPKPRIS